MLKSSIKYAYGNAIGSNKKKEKISRQNLDNIH